MQKASAWQARWLPLVPLVDLLLRDTYCPKEIPVAGCLVHLLPLSEVIQANHWVLKIIHQGYSIELIQTPQFQGVGSTPVPHSRGHKCCPMR